MLIAGAATCSPIAQLDNIDFGKVLSTRGDKTFINELTSGHKVQFLEADQQQQVSPMPKLNLSVLSDPQQHQNLQNGKTMSRREQEFLERINRLKHEDNPITSNRMVGSLNENSEQLVKGPPKFIGHIDKQMTAISRNKKNLV